VADTSPLTLVERQRLFARLLVTLLQRAAYLAYDVRMGECWRTPEQAAWNAAHGRGIAHSLHCDRLAVDLLLDKDGVWLRDGPAGYDELGAWWKMAHELCRWGGDFASKDYGHYSITYQGRQ
jgi:hypothetical protein